MTEATQSGLSDNAAGAIAYITIIPAIVFLVMEPYNRKPFVKFHCWQCLGLFVCCLAINIVLGIIPVVGWLLIPFVDLGIFILAIVCIVKAVNGGKLTLPLIGAFAEKQANA